MVELSLEEIVDVLDGKLLSNKKIIKSINNVSTDTRAIKEGDIFFALKGENFNANKYIDTAFNNGASLCIVEEVHIEISDIPANAEVILVDNVEIALGKLAKYYLDKVNVKVIGVTGSVGKTSTKDMIAASLSEQYKVLKTLGNFNNHIGLPLTIFRLDSSYDVAILEMGMSHANEIDYLAEIAQPDIVVITNIGLSHIENLGSQKNILNAKMEATNYFGKDNVLIVNGDDAFLNTVSSNKYRVVKTGINSNSDITALNLQLKELSSSFELLNNGQKYECNLELPGKHNVINYLLAVAICNELGVSIESMAIGMKNIEKTSMRLDISNVNGYTIINDCYNASPDSMKSAIDVQLNMGSTRNIAVLGSMFELGEMSNMAHQDVAQYLLDKDIDIVFTTGIYTDNYKYVLGDKCKLYEDKDCLIKELRTYIQEGDSILIKASRGAKFEYIYKNLIE